MSGWPGLQADCEALLRRFQESESVRFEDFASLWREQRFHTIFYGKIRTPEQIKFTKEALALLWPYFLPPYTFQIRVGALYLLYGFYNTQLCQPKQKIRVALKDWFEVCKFQQELLNAQHYDAAYIFRKLRIDKAFYFTAMPKFLSFRTKKKMNNSVEMTGEFRDPTDRVSMLSPAEFLEETRNVHEHYQKMKCLISTNQSEPDRAIDMIKDDFLASFKNIVLEYRQWQKNKMYPSLAAMHEEVRNEEEGSSQDSEGAGRARLLADIKSRSYSTVAQTSKSRRHRQIKLESSESGSDHGKTTSPRAKKARKTPQPTQRTETVQKRGLLQSIREQSAKNLSMPVIVEGESEEEDHSSDEDYVPTKKKKRTR
ncbi:snRNA-activating protein complex subunit 1 [Pogona vitticeps]